MTISISAIIAGTGLCVLIVGVAKIYKDRRFNKYAASFEKTKKEYGVTMAVVLWFRKLPNDFISKQLNLEQWIEAWQHSNKASNPAIFKDFVWDNVVKCLGREKNFNQWHEIFNKNSADNELIKDIALSMMTETATDITQLRLVLEASPPHSCVHHNALHKIHEIVKSL